MLWECAPLTVLPDRVTEALEQPRFKGTKECSGETCSAQLCNDMFGQKTAPVVFWCEALVSKVLKSLQTGSKNEELVLQTLKRLGGTK